MNNKRKIYIKNGVPYYKMGGQFYKLKKAQLGVDTSVVQGITDSLMNAESDALETDYKPGFMKQLGQFIKKNPNDSANYASSALSAFDQSQADTSNPMVSRMMANYDSEGASNFTNTALDVASMIPAAAPVAKGIKAALALGKSVGNLMPTDEYGETKTAAGQAFKGILDLPGTVDDSFEMYRDVGGGTSGLKAAAKNLVTLGNSGREYRINKFKTADKRQDYLDSLDDMGSAQGNYRNDGIYAKRGIDIGSYPNYNSNKEPNVEIEDGEIILGNPKQVSIPKGVGATTSMESSFGAKFHGDKHGEDSDKDGKEGIPLNAEGGYVASNYLDLYGRPVRKNKKSSGKSKNKKQKGGRLSSKTVSKEMEPNIKFLEQVEENPSDLYKNNPIAIKHSVQQLDKMKNMAETNKFRRELEKMIKDDKIPFDQILQFITENAPVDNFSQQEQQAMQQLVQSQRQEGPQQEGAPTQGQEEMMPASPAQGGMPEVPPEVMQQLMAQEMGPQGAPMGMQEGGVPPGDQPMPEENLSQQRMAQLEAKAQKMGGNDIINPAVNELSPKVQEMYAQLPQEIKEQMASVPADQLEIAIMNAFEAMNQGANLPQPPAPAIAAPGMGQTEGPSPEEQAMQQVMMMMGGDMNDYSVNRPGYTDEYFGDKYRQHGGDLQMRDEAAMRQRLAHQPRNPYVEKFNPATGTHTKPHAAFQDHYQVGGAMSSDMTKLYRQYMDMGYSNAAAIEMARQKMGQMQHGGKLKPGMSVKFKSGGKMVNGKVKKINPNGTIELY